MEITVNGSKKDIKSTLISELVVELQLKTNGIALALNQNILPFKEWDSTSLTNGDSITIIKATQGR